MKDSRITVYIPKDEIDMVCDGKCPSEYWNSKPSNWDKADIIELSISLEVYSKWLHDKNKVSKPQLLKD